MNLLFIGDVVGEPGRTAVRELVPKLKERFSLDMVIANGENSAGGSGITVSTANELFNGGVDIITTGDHLWDQKDVTVLLANEKRFLRPLNYPAGTPGQGSLIHTLPSGLKVGVMNLQGRTFMAAIENPFTLARDEVVKLRGETPIIFIDIHAEATSEKIALARMLDGQVSAVVGTHTHVQTADEQIFPGGTAFLCDAGFTGAQESVLGREIAPVVTRFLTNSPQRFHVAKTRVALFGVVVQIDNITGKATRIERIQEFLPIPVVV